MIQEKSNLQSNGLSTRKMWICFNRFNTPVSGMISANFGFGSGVTSTIYSRILSELLKSEHAYKFITASEALKSLSSLIVTTEFCDDLDYATMHTSCSIKILIEVFMEFLYHGVLIPENQSRNNNDFVFLFIKDTVSFYKLLILGFYCNQALH